MGFMDEYYKALQEPNQNSGSTNHAVSNTRSSYLDEYNMVITNAVLTSKPGQMPGYRANLIQLPLHKPGTGGFTTLPLRPGDNSNKYTTLPLRPESGGSLVDLPIRKEVEARLTVGNKKEEDEEEEKKWYQKGHFEDGWDFGDITKTILGIDKDTASFKDLTWNSLRRGYYNSVYGEESYKEMLGDPNKKEDYKKLLESDEYQFAPGNELASGISGAMEMIGQ